MSIGEVKNKILKSVRTVGLPLEFYFDIKVLIISLSSDEFANHYVISSFIDEINKIMVALEFTDTNID